MGSKRRPSQEGLEALFRREFAPMVRALTLLGGDAEAAADAVQDAFVEKERATLDLPPVLSRLPEQQWAVVTLSYLLEQPTSVVADTLGVTEATVRPHLRHARVRLAGSLRDARLVARAGEVAT